MSETKIVITLKERAALVAMQKTDCDPIIFHPVAFNNNDELKAMLGILLSNSLEEAQRRWETNPRNPQTKVSPPPPPPTPTPAATVTTARPSAQSSQNLQRSLF